ncbi:MAG: ribulose-phosphate 3-epimerase [Firmicutes bacterium GWF2_51_9]|nr:ribulose-phosphate 3-epimerase [Erysipelotrichaceae bacterium]OGS54625.1 MAG: ribulose-phosphate 3-epimerase [Firmicutes bacterium GWF2_51_9]OGS59255.1 MAG: ribulose-phosphate 3-epimerase [Firmicutes bacterium GWE2_51_13]HAM62307.1 ribulose-phosphate 3-epimerase [Erysipelotrichaceae bacterium]HAO61247.1 ribulose-phosphate 3-epimerase [Erysipelotrichaceae bacterium]
MIIAPSILSMDFSSMESQLNQVKEGGAAWLHFDVMDGHFVRNLTFGPDLLKGVRKLSDLVMDVHIMVEDPAYFAPVFMDAGADGITFHIEACKDLDEVRSILAMIRSKNKRAGISLRPQTPIESLYPILDECDMVLIMSVNPGFGGQAFIEDSLKRIAELRDEIQRRGLSVLIEVDGGINKTTGKACQDAGADVLVAGSYVFKNDIPEAIRSLM